MKFCVGQAQSEEQLVKCSLQITLIIHSILKISNLNLMAILNLRK